MKKAQVGSALLGGICAFVGIAYAQHAGSDHLMVTPVDLKWALVAALPGAQIAVIEGPMNKAGAPFTARLKNMGFGDKLDTSKTQSLGLGSVSIHMDEAARRNAMSDSGLSVSTPHDPAST